MYTGDWRRMVNNSNDMHDSKRTSRAPAATRAWSTSARTDSSAVARIANTSVQFWFSICFMFYTN